VVIEGFRFESAVSREDLRRLRPPAGGGRGRRKRRGASPWARGQRVRRPRAKKR